MNPDTFDISNREASIYVVVGIILLVVLMFFGFNIITKYIAKREPKTLRELLGFVNINFEDKKYKNNKNLLLDYLRKLETNPARHYEFGAIFALIAKNNLRLDHPAEAFYYAKVSDYYYGLFNVVIDPNDDSSTLIGNLRMENEKIDTQAGLMLDADKKNRILEKISSRLTASGTPSSNDWLSSAPVSELG